MLFYPLIIFAFLKSKYNFLKNNFVTGTSIRLLSAIKIMPAAARGRSRTPARPDVAPPARGRSRSLSRKNSTTSTTTSTTRSPSRAMSTMPGQIAHVNYHGMNDRVFAFFFFISFIAIGYLSLTMPETVIHRSKNSSPLSSGSHFVIAMDASGGTDDTADWADIASGVTTFAATRTNVSSNDRFSVIYFNSEDAVVIDSLQKGVYLPKPSANLNNDVKSPSFFRSLFSIFDLETPLDSAKGPLFSLALNKALVQVL